MFTQLQDTDRTGSEGFWSTERRIQHTVVPNFYLARGIRDPGVHLEGLPAANTNTRRAVDTGPCHIIPVAQLAEIINADAQDRDIGAGAEFHQVDGICALADDFEPN